MIVSNHAVARSNQRGIPLKILNLIIEMGTPIRKPGGAIEYYFRKKDKIKLQKELKRIIQNIDKAEGDAVLTINGKIITVYHRN
ncbi:MAG: hypothetical protein K9N07_11785 [Candidatus Cloacimonetes bacterium]|nr:hypothetical protein [Candidatus Cloacimonadota bacterium]